MGKVFSTGLIAAVLALVPLQLWAADAPLVDPVAPAGDSAAPAAAPAPTAVESAVARPNSQREPTGTVIQHYGPEVQCLGCSPVSRQVKEWGAKILKAFKDTGQLPDYLIRLTGAEIDPLLRGKSWSADMVAGFDDEEMQRLLAFDNDGRGRWLNFMHGPKGYSTLCEFKVDEDMLCLSCAPSPAQCSEVYRDKDPKGPYLALDREKGVLELYDWIMDSRWENDRFLAPH